MTTKKKENYGYASMKLRPLKAAEPDLLPEESYSLNYFHFAALGYHTFQPVIVRLLLVVYR